MQKKFQNAKRDGTKMDRITKKEMEPHIRKKLEADEQLNHYMKESYKNARSMEDQSLHSVLSSSSCKKHAKEKHYAQNLYFKGR